MRVNNILETIGDTPHIRINRLFDPRVAVWMKAERTNPGGSIKDRIGLAMIEDAERRGLLGPDSLIVEPTSGNTGVGLAIVAAVKGYRLLLVMPESMSIERRRLFAVYGADMELTPRELGMKGAIERAAAIVENTPGAWMPQQFENEANVEVHRLQTAQEILRDFPDGIDYLITGVGTGGHISGVSEILKERFPRLQTFAVEPEKSPVISGGAPSPHRLQGIGAGFVPPTCISRHLTVSSRSARRMLRLRSASRSRGGHFRWPIFGRRARSGRQEASGDPGRQRRARRSPTTRASATSPSKGSLTRTAAPSGRRRNADDALRVPACRTGRASEPHPISSARR